MVDIFKKMSYNIFRGDVYGIEDFLRENGAEGALVFKDFDYDTAIVGVSSDGRVIYDYDLMIEYLINQQDMNEEEAVEWIDYNTLGAIKNEHPYPIVMYKIM